MIKVSLTENFTGFNIQGDYFDLDGLYDALSGLLDHENRPENDYTTDQMIYALMYDIRHANMGDRTFVNVENAVHDHVPHMREMILPKSNVYASFNILYPLTVFIILAIEDLVEEYIRRHYRGDYHLVGKYLNDKTILAVKHFQSLLLQAVFEQVDERAASRIKNTISRRVHGLEDFHHQYIDKLNVAYIHSDKEKRSKQLAVMFKRFTSPNKDYYKLEDTLEYWAKEHKCHPSQLSSEVDYPSEIIW